LRGKTTLDSRLRGNDAGLLSSSLVKCGEVITLPTTLQRILLATDMSGRCDRAL